MTHQEYCKDIISFLTKEKAIESLIELTYEEAQEKNILEMADFGG